MNTCLPLSNKNRGVRKSLFLCALSLLTVTFGAKAQTQTFTTPVQIPTELGFSGQGSYFTTTGITPGVGAYGIQSGSATVTFDERIIPQGTPAGSIFSFDLANPVGNFNTTSSVQVLLSIDGADFAQELNIVSTINAGSYAFGQYTTANDATGAVTKTYTGSSSTITVVAITGGSQNQRPVSTVTITLPAATALAGRRVSPRIILNSAPGAALLIDNVRLARADGTPLPVTLARFAAAPSAAGVLVSWATATEKNNDRFEVQRSADGQAFQTIGTVKGHGNSSSLQEYSFTDSRPFADQSYYRLRQVDIDGTASFSPVAVVTSRSSQNALAYPNPSTGSLKLPASASTIHYRIFNALGQTLLIGQGTSNETIDLTRIPKGPFFLEMNGAAGRTTQRLVRE